MDLGIEGKVAVVAASSKGLGRASAEALAAEGCKVVVCSRNADELQAMAEPIGALAVPMDITEPDAPSAWSTPPWPSSAGSTSSCPTPAARPRRARSTSPTSRSPPR
jgi:hypothetical protein